MRVNMRVQLFETQLRQHENFVIIDLNGELNANAEAGLNQAFSQALDFHPKVILLNFRQVSFINSTGIALIVSILAEARKKQVKLCVFDLSEHYRRVFQITRLSDYLAIYPDEASALTSSSTNGGNQ